MITPPEPRREGEMRNYAIVLAADLPTANEVLSVVKEVGIIVDGVKVGVTTLLEAGKDILSRIRDVIQDSPLLVDLKVADIGFLADGVWQGTNAKIIKSLENSGATHVTVHGFPGPVSVAEAVATAREAEIGGPAPPPDEPCGRWLVLFQTPRLFLVDVRHNKSRNGCSLPGRADLPRRYGRDTGNGRSSGRRRLHWPGHASA